MLFIQDYILLPYYQTNTWLIYDSDSRDAILIDPSAPDEALLKHIRSLELKVHYIVKTHGHGDHIGAMTGLEKNSKHSLLYTVLMLRCSPTTRKTSALIWTALVKSAAESFWKTIKCSKQAQSSSE
jgi:glyoxylase-like metal-dependent hydrolase (beta-lactamase superfamily II)